MKYPYFENANPFVKLIFVTALMAVSYLVFFVISLFITIPFYGTSMRELMEIVEGNQLEENIALLKFLQIFYSIGIFLVPGLLAGYFIQRNSLGYIHAKKSPSPATVFLVIILMAASVPIINVLIGFNSSLSLPDKLSGIEEKIRISEEDASMMMNAFLSTPGWLGFMVNLIMIAVIPALGEEFLFRGVIQRILTEWLKNHHLAIIVSAIFFSVMHFQFLGFLPRMILGILLGYVFVWSGSIWIPVIGHFINNAMAVVFFFLHSQEVIRYDLDSLGSTRETWIFAGFSVLAVAVMMTAIYYNEKKKFS